jgi:nucleotide-binding universal stress UspA family protein
LIQAADSINVVTVNSKGSQSELGKGIDGSNYLTRHRVNVKLYLEQTDEGSPTVGQLLLAHADENDIDLAIGGGYSHSRLRKLMLGGNTRYLNSACEY